MTLKSILSQQSSRGNSTFILITCSMNHDMDFESNLIIFLTKKNYLGKLAELTSSQLSSYFPLQYNIHT